MGRELGGFERAQALTAESYAYNVVAALRLRGRPEAARLEAALAALQRRHPLLRSRVDRRGGRWRFEIVDGAPIPLRRLERSGGDGWRAAAAEEVNRPIASDAAPLARCVLVASRSDEAGSEVLLSLHHAIVDAVSVATVCRELLAACGGAATPPAVAAAELPPRPEERFPRRFRGLARIPALAAFLARQAAGEVAFVWRTRGLGSPVPAAPARCELLSRALGESATAALLRRCRRERVPVNSALNAALLLAVQRHRRGGRATALRHFAFPDLRPYLEPPMGPEPVGSYMVIQRFTQRLRRDERFWELARRHGEALHRSFRRGEKFLFSLAIAPMMRMILGLGRLRMGSAALSYTGPLGFPDEFGELGIRGVHAFVTNPPIGAEVAAQARLFRGRLWWDFTYLDADMDAAGAATIAADILFRLEEAAREPD